jgi:hypothetical protein
VEVNNKTLAILTASFILLISSFTFSSCKECDKKELKFTGIDNMQDQDPVAPNTSESKKELTLLDLVKAAAWHTCRAYCAACEAKVAWSFGPFGDMPTAKTQAQNASNEKKKVEDLTKSPVVAEAKHSKDKNIVAHANAIGLLFERAKLDEALALAATNNGSRDEINEQTEEARNAWEGTYTKAQAEDTDALRIAEKMFVEATVSMCGEGENVVVDNAKNNFFNNWSI